MTKVQGKRSPRWAFMQRMMIPCKDGTEYLVRLRIVQTPWLALYVHDIHEDDGDRPQHSHPWTFISIILRGSYLERLYPDPIGRPNYYVLNEYNRWTWHRMGRDTAHRIVDASPGLKTLIITGKRQASWGFFVDGKLVDWADYERQIGIL